jgi:DNA-binding PadR family transcriptional regulator
MEKSMTPLDFLLLGLLTGGPRSGYDLRKWIAQTPLRGYSDSPGAIYPALRRLAKRGCVRIEKPTGGRRRQQAEITDFGMQAFLDWLHRPVERQDVISRGEELLLRFAFMGPIGLDDLALQFLEQYERENTAYLATLQEHLSEKGDQLPLTGRLTLELGLEQFQARIRWAKRSRRALDDKRQDQPNGGIQ